MCSYRDFLRMWYDKKGITFLMKIGFERRNLIPQVSCGYGHRPLHPSPHPFLSPTLLT